MHWLCWHVSKFFEFGEDLLAGKFGQIFLVKVNPERCNNRSAILSLRPTTVNSFFCFFFFFALRSCHTHDSNVRPSWYFAGFHRYNARSHRRGMAMCSCSKFVMWIILQSDWYRQNPAAGSPRFDPPNRTLGYKQFMQGPWNPLCHSCPRTDVYIPCCGH